ncbi:putative C31G5.21 protein [Polychytrium aggregatum]|uniref:putative C31G5.21 protein n=1 Tax=Polychytrium aggregatum TaxID=110093 RepID=UPI0022FEAB81|nr:putative C31G5.21 protein [Polychytrium aggregatum]KAI9203999.1 putative C31G5.21 protein [Polychytrium aggregatum]
MSDYGNFTGGGLKLKGSSGIKKKKKDKKESKKRLEHVLKEDVHSDRDSTQDDSAPSSVLQTLPPSRKTKAELKFEEAQMKRQSEKIEKIVSKSHKERVSEFNNYLSSLSEHHDIPKVGPG